MIIWSCAYLGNGKLHIFASIFVLIFAPKLSGLIPKALITRMMIGPSTAAA